MSPCRPLEGAGAARRALPFVVASLLAVVLVPLAGQATAAALVAPWAVTALGLLAFALAPWRRLPAGAQVLPALGWLGVVLWLREAHQVPGLYAPLTLVSILWLALYGTRRQLAVALAGVGVVLAGPSLWHGSTPGDPASDLVRAVLWVTPGGALGFTVQGLVARLRISEERHRTVVRRLPGTGTLLLDRDLRVVLAEGPLIERVGLTPEGMVGRAFAELLSPGGAERLGPHLRAALAGEQRSAEWEGGDGVVHAMQFVPYGEGPGTARGVLVVSTDVSEQRRAERARNDAEQRFRATFEHAPIGMALLDDEGLVLQANPALSRLTGRVVADLEGRPLRDLAHPDDREASCEALAGLLRDEPGCEAFERRVVRADGSVLWVTVHGTVVRDGEGRPLYVLAQFQDVTERRRTEARLRHLADHDTLTGLLNRRGFEQALGLQLATRRPGALLLLDLDHFKAVNDGHGHAAGDALLTACAKGLRARLRETDAVARLGGDEFAVLLDGVDAATALRIAGELAATVAAASAPWEAELARPVTASVGVTALDGRGGSGGELLEQADQAMYAAKAAGRAVALAPRPLAPARP